MKTLKINGENVPVKHTSKIYTIGWKDGLKAFLIAAGTPVIDMVIQALNNNDFQLDWKRLLAIGLSAGLMYLVKNFFTPSQLVINKNEI